MTPSPYLNESVARLAPYVPGLQKPGVLKLNTNENPYPPPATVAQALATFDAETLRLYPEPNADTLRDALAEHFGCKRENVFVGNGSDEILRLAVQAFTPAAHPAAGAFHPTYSLYPVLARAASVPWKQWELADDGSYGWPEEMPGLEETGVFFLANPNAPTGTLADPAAVEALADRVPGVLLVDEAYIDFAGPGATALPLALARPDVLATRTFSKAGAMAGARLGIAVGDAGLIDGLMRLKDSYNVNRLSQALALAELAGWSEVRAAAGKIATTRDETAAALAAKGWEVTPSRANFLWAKPPAGRSAKEVYDHLAAQDILVRHFPDDPRTRDHLRISIGKSEDMERFLAALPRA
jgi:histidinol-phosphate aminotransferase